MKLKMMATFSFQSNNNYYYYFQKLQDTQTCKISFLKRWYKYILMSLNNRQSILINFITKNQLLTDPKKITSSYKKFNFEMLCILQLLKDL